MAISKPIPCQGQEFASITALSEHFGVSKQKVTKRLAGGWTPEQAVGVTDPPRRAGSRSVPVVFKGVRYDSLVEASLDLGLEPATIAARVHKGYTTDEALSGDLKGRSGNRAKPIDFQGKTFSSREELCAGYGQHWGIVQARVKRGWTMEQALMIEPPPPRYRDADGNARQHTWTAVRISSDGTAEPIPDADGFKLYLITNTDNGKGYVGLTVNSLAGRLKQHFAAARSGVKSAFANAIRKYGEKAFRIELLSADAKSFAQLQEQEVREIASRDSIKKGYNVAHGGSVGTAKGITIDGKTYASYAMAAEVYGVDPAVMSVRLTRLGWSPEEAVGLVTRDWESKEVPVDIKGKQFESIKKAAEFYGKSYKTVHNRHRLRGWTLEQALDLAPPPTTSKYGGQSLTVSGAVYGSFGEAGRALGINPESFRKRVQQGMSPEEAYRRARRK